MSTPDNLSILPRQRALFNDDWRFYLGDAGDAAAPEFDDSFWRTLNLPHDWGIEGEFEIDLPGETGKLPWAGVGWYRKGFAVAANVGFLRALNYVY